MTTVAPFLWFESGAAEAFALYSRVFGAATEQPPESAPYFIGTVTLPGMNLMVFNGGPHVPFNDAISLMVTVDTQDEVDHFWHSLSDGGAPGRCGWLTDPFGVRWQIVPRQLGELMSDPDPVKAGRVRDAMLAMDKLIIADLEAAYAG